MRFVDRAKIFIKSGKGGDGKISFRHEKYIALGGPDGGDGGRGGAVIFYVDEKKETLFDFSRKIHFKAQSGEDGGGSDCHGKSGQDLVIHIPLGTQIYDDKCEILYFDAVNVNESYVFFEKSKGGLGNARFVTSVNRAPKERTVGEPSKEAWICLVLKIFCDYGFVGLPNAGKSSLLKILTGSKTKISDYPFTTLSPELGALYKNNERIILADLPGLISGASNNKGLGVRFLGHVERCKGLVHVIDISLRNSLDILRTLFIELSAFSKDLINKKQIIVLNKIDLLSSNEIEEELSCLKEGLNNLMAEFNVNFATSIITLSAQQGVGMESLLDALYENL